MLKVIQDCLTPQTLTDKLTPSRSVYGVEIMMNREQLEGVQSFKYLGTSY